MSRLARILLVDDDPEEAEMMLFTLSKLSWCEFHYVGDGVDALSYLYAQDNPDPDLIILDLRMPKVDGVDVLRRLKCDNEKANIPVVALISSPQGQTYLESFGIKAQGYLLKPVEVNQFLGVLTELGLSSFTLNKEITPLR
jgi:two-component system, response regulator